MDFFEQQDQARAKTATLVFYFLMAVVCIIVAVFALFSAVFMQMEEYRSLAWSIDLALMTTVGTVSVVAWLASAESHPFLRRVLGGGSLGRQVDLTQHGKSIREKDSQRGGGNGHRIRNARSTRLLDGGRRHQCLCRRFCPS